MRLTFIAAVFGILLIASGQVSAKAKDALSEFTILDLYINAKYAEEDATTQATLCRKNDLLALRRINALRERMALLERWVVESSGAAKFDAALVEYDEAQHSLYRVCPKRPIDPAKSIANMQRFVRALEDRQVKAKVQQ